MSQRCFKCSEASGSIPSRNGVSKLYCVDCFSEFCVKALKNSLFTHCGLPSDEPVAVGVSGGINSMFLLYQLGILRVMGSMRGGEGRTTFFFLPFHLCEEELVLPVTSSPPSVSSSCTSSSNSSPFEQLIQSRSSATDSSTRLSLSSLPLQFKQQNSLLDHLKNQFQLLQTSILQQMERWEWSNQPLFSHQQGAETLKLFCYSDFFSEAEMNFLRAVLHSSHISHNCREELYFRVREGVLRAAACRMSSDWKNSHPQSVTTAEAVPLHSTGMSQWVHYLSGDNALRCSVNALHSIVSGGGGCNLVQRAGFCSFFYHVRQMRPLRMLLSKEIFFFNRIHGIEGLYTPTLSTGSSLSSVRRVLDEFIHEMVSSHQTIVFNVLSAVSHLDTERLFPLSSDSLDGQKESDMPQKKRAVFGKVVARHEYLIKNRPPHLLSFWDSPSSSSTEEKMCFMCGCPIYCAEAVRVAESEAISGSGVNEENEQELNQNDAKSTEMSCLVCCIPCRECLNSTFYSKRGVGSLSMAPWIDICKNYFL